MSIRSIALMRSHVLLLACAHTFKSNTLDTTRRLFYKLHLIDFERTRMEKSERRKDDVLLYMS
jgi:hypothetical protein